MKFNSDSQARYLVIALCVIVFVILYVWQNITVMKIKMGYRAALEREREFRDRNDRGRYEIEKLRRLESVERAAIQAGMRPLTPADLQVLVAPKGGGK